MQWEFKATPQPQPSQLPTRTVLATAPEARFGDTASTALTASTTYSVTVVCITPNDKRVPALAALTMTTPAPG